MLPWGVSAQKILLECWYIPVIVNNIILIDAWVYLVDLFSLVPVLVLVTECANFAFINCLSGWNRDSDLLYLLSDKMHCGEYTHLVLFAQLMRIFFSKSKHFQYWCLFNNWYKAWTLRQSYTCCTWDVKSANDIECWIWSHAILSSLYILCFQFHVLCILLFSNA
jgi:hypothetical protein